MVKVTDVQNCCGCTLCACICPQKAVTMKPDSMGFMYPSVDDAKCTNCGLCKKKCPIENRINIPIKNSNIKQAFAVRLKDTAILKTSSSGGAFFSIALYVLKKGGVVYGAVYDDQMKVIHRGATSHEECLLFQGSKYSQSELGNTFSEIKNYLANGRIVLFSGTPCQNDALIKYLRTPYRNLITVDIICHSIPSPRFFKEYVDMIEKKYGEKVVNISMRDKTYGWGVNSYKYIFHSGKSLLNPKGIKCWQDIFESGFITRESCFNCQYSNLMRTTDFTIGDFWDFSNKRPDLKSKEGTSVLFVNSDKAVSLFEEIKENLHYWPVEEIAYMQPRLKCCSTKPADYDLFRIKYNEQGFISVYKEFFGGEYTISYRVRNLISNLLHSIVK